MTDRLTFRATTGSNVQPGEQCSQCKSQAWRTLGSLAYCQPCREELLQPIHERAFLPEGFDGTGRPTGTHTGAASRHIQELECHQCAATWVGKPGEYCAYCAGLYSRSVSEQKRLLLRPELPDTDSTTRPAALTAWADRLAVAITAEVITRQQARQAFNRETMKAERRHAA